MDKILIITEEYVPNANATGICTQSIVDELKKKSYVTVLSKTNLKKGAKVYKGEQIFYQYNKWWEFRNVSSKNKFRQFALQLLKRVHNVLMKPFYPIESFSSLFRLIYTTYNLQKNNNYKKVVCFFHPTESILVGVFLKKLFPDIKFILYMLDSLANYTPTLKLLPKSFCHKRNIIYEYVGYKYADLIIHLMVQKKYYFNNESYIDFYRKFRFADIPLFKNIESNNKTRRKKVLLYTGSLNHEFRNPQYALSLLAMIDVQVNFFCSGDCDHIVKEYANNNDNINFCGYVEHSKIKEEILCAEVLLNFGNFRLNMIPSKIFEYFSYQKKIIHFYKDDFDTCLPYLKKYPYALLIDEREDVFINRKKIINFLDETIIKSDTWKQVFYRNTPSFSCNIILKEI